MPKRRARWSELLLSFVVCAGLASACAEGAESAGVQAPSVVATTTPPVVPAPAPVAATDWGKAPPTGAEAEKLVAYTDPGELPKLVVASDRSPFPLEHTHVKATLTGFVAEVEVRQTYKNPQEKPIEAVYVFPLPENSAVHAMRMEIGKRVIEAKIEKREAARQVYERAKSRGQTAALLEQERPNVFTQSVANIAPGEKIDVVVRYVQDLTYDAGQYEFVFPMVVGPRYVPGAPLDQPPSGTGTKADTTRVPDASRISPPIMGKGERSGHDISLELVADASNVIGDVEVPTHEVVMRRPADGSVRVTLAEKDSLPNRDFVMRYRVAGEEPKATLYTAGGFFSLVVQPPALDVDALVGRREMIFVVDVSGSMSGVPLAMCKDAMKEALGELRPVDTFNIITFAGASQKAFPTPRPANQATLDEAFRVVDRMEAGGGTEMLNAVDSALGTDVEPGKSRYVFFMTDGYVGNEAEIIDKSGKFVAALEKKGQRARVFGFGAGSSVNRYLIDGLASAGKGLAVYATTREDPRSAVNRFYHYVDRAVLTGLAIDWGGTRASELEPTPLPDLFASHPVILHGRLAAAPSVPPAITAKAGDRIVKIPVTLRHAETEGDARSVLGLLWARAKVGNLERDLWDGEKPESQGAIEKLGLDFGLVTRFTSFVAVDTSRKVGDGNPDTVAQPVEQPEGVDVTMAGGATIGGLAPPAVEAAYGGEAVREMEEVAPGARGCGCRTVPAERDHGAILAALGLGLALAWRRRKRDA